MEKIDKFVENNAEFIVKAFRYSWRCALVASCVYAGSVSTKSAMHALDVDEKTLDDLLERFQEDHTNLLNSLSNMNGENNDSE